VQVTPEIQTRWGVGLLGAETVPPLMARGVLIDVGGGEPAREIPLAEIRAAAAAQRVEPRAGDVVLIRTGNGANWGKPDEYLRGAGMASGISRWLADVGAVAVGADNIAWDWLESRDKDLGASLPGHVILLMQAGIYILENLYLEELAEDGVHEFAFVCLPLKLVGATGSPVRPLALALAPG